MELLTNTVAAMLNQGVNSFHCDNSMGVGNAGRIHLYLNLSIFSH